MVSKLRGACRRVGWRRSRTIYSACSPRGGDNLGCVAPSRTRLTYGHKGTRENDGPGTTVTTPGQYSSRAIARPHLHPLGVNRGSCYLPCTPQPLAGRRTERTSSAASHPPSRAVLLFHPSLQVRQIR